MDKSRLLITGIKGLIGRASAPYLARYYTICGLDLGSAGGKYPSRKVNITDSRALLAAFRRFSPIRDVLHLAADPRVDAPWESALSNNIQGTWNVFNAAALTGVRRVVFASSNHVTGGYENGTMALSEQQQPPKISVRNAPRPDSPYGISKLAGEGIARFFFDHQDLEAVCLRIGSVLEEDPPGTHPRHRATWLSHRDLCHLLERSLLAERSFPGFGIYYGVSDNTRRFWRLENARRELGFHPEDDAEQFYRGG